MATVFRRVPPPPSFAINDPVFNRWLHDLTAFIQESGGIDTGTIPGYDDLTSTVATHSTEIATNTSQIASNSSQIATNTAGIATNTSNIAALTARSQVLHGIAAPAAGLGVDGDWFSDTVAKHIYVRVSGSWVLII